MFKTLSFFCLVLCVGVGGGGGGGGRGHKNNLRPNSGNAADHPVTFNIDLCFAKGLVVQ